MAEIINLRRARKAAVKAKATQDAAENRVLHGRTKSEQERDRKQADQERRRLDALRRDEP